MRVIVSGLLKPRTYETKAGEKRTVIELEVDEVGPSLRYATATVQRSQGPRPTPAAGAGQGEVHPVDSLSISPREYADDDPWFGIQANPAGRINTSVQDAEPAF
jgi:single-strand DNA-binding protein